MPSGSAPSKGVGVSEQPRRSLVHPRYGFAFLASADGFFLGLLGFSLRMNERPRFSSAVRSVFFVATGASEQCPSGEKALPKSRLRPVEHVKEHHYTEAAKSIDKRLEEHDRWNHAPQDIEEGENKIPYEESRHQNRSDQS